MYASDPKRTRQSRYLLDRVSHQTWFRRRFPTTASLWHSIGSRPVQLRFRVLWRVFGNPRLNPSVGTGPDCSATFQPVRVMSASTSIADSKGARRTLLAIRLMAAEHDELAITAESAKAD